MSASPPPHPRRRRWLFALALLLVVGIGSAWLSRSWFAAPREQTLRWGGDATGGEPYLIGDPEAAEPMGGFEGEIAAYLGGKLGLPARFVQRTWANLPQDLARGDVDVILNGYEWFPSREEEMTSTIPYFAYRLRLIARKGGPVHDWADLRRKPGQRKPTVGVLRDSAAQRYLEEAFRDDVKIEAYDEEGVTGVMGKVVDGSLDATVQDAPAASWYLRSPKYAGQYTRLHQVGEAVKPTKYNYYVLFVRKDDRDRKQKLDDAIRQGLEDGTFRAIYEKYGLWDVDQADLLDVARHWPPVEKVERPPLGWFARQLAWASLTTIALALLSFPLAMLLGLLVAVGRLHGPRILAFPLAVYVEVIRGTPLLLQLSVIYFILPRVGIRLDAFWAGVAGLALNYAAYEAEIYRAGLLAIPRGQMEAALSLGMTSSTALWRILVPQAVRLVVPPVTNDFIALFKDTSVCAVFAVTELTARYRYFAVNNPGLILELGLLTALLYLLMSYPLSLLARRLERQQQSVHA